MTPADLDHLEALASAATEGPWKQATHCVWAGDREPSPFTDTGVVCRTHYDHTIRPRERADAAFIAASRTAIPDFCRALREAWDERETARAQLDAVRRIADSHDCPEHMQRHLLAALGGGEP